MYSGFIFAPAVLDCTLADSRRTKIEGQQKRGRADVVAYEQNSDRYPYHKWSLSGQDHESRSFVFVLTVEHTVLDMLESHEPLEPFAYGITRVFLPPAGEA